MEGGKNTNYCPGFVDALTNVVIAMVFIIIVLALSLSFSAQLLAKRMAARITELEQQGKSTQMLPFAPPVAPAAVTPPVAQGTAAPPDSGVPGTIRIPVRGNEGKAKVQGGNMRVAAQFLLLEFEASALTLDEAAEKQLGQSLDQITSRLQNAPKNTRVILIVSGPDMALSKNQRSGYIRTMAVRNALLQKGIPGARIGTRFDLKANVARANVSIAIEHLEQDMTAEDDRVKRTVVTAPVAGTVNKLLANTVGGVIRPGETLLELTPADGAVVIESRATPAERGPLQVGQRAVVRAAVFDYTVFGTLPARITEINAGSLTDERGERYFRIGLLVDAASQRTFGRPLTPGSAVTADLVTGRRTVTQYLLSPLRGLASTAFRDRH